MKRTLVILLIAASCSRKMSLPSTKNYALSLGGPVKAAPAAPPLQKEAPKPANEAPPEPAKEAAPETQELIPVPQPQEEKPFIITVVVTNVVITNNIHITNVIQPKALPPLAEAPLQDPVYYQARPVRRPKVNPQGIIYAARAGDLESVQNYLAMGVPPDTRDTANYGATALIAAIGERHTHIIEELLNAGASVQATAVVNGVSGITPLMVASQGGPLSAAKMLVEAGADVNAVTEGDGAGSTALMAAAAAGKNDILQFLISQGADVNAKNITGRSALMMAAQKGNTGGIEILLKSPEIRPNDTDRSGLNALEFARQSGQRGAEQALMRLRF